MTLPSSTPSPAGRQTATSDSQLIAASAISLRYPTGRLALDGASLVMGAGELVVLLGANGCGKTTLLRCIAGMLRPTAGRVQVAGRDLSALSGHALRDARMALGMVFQQPRLVRRRSVLANVVAGTLGRHRTWTAALGRLPRSEYACALSCLEEVGLAEFAPQRADTLSGGQAQRVSVARALAQRPRALLADEPVASLDPDAAEELMVLLCRLAHEDGLGVLCVLHQPDLARRYADRVLGMRAGQIVFDERPGRGAAWDVSALYETAEAA